MRATMISATAMAATARVTAINVTIAAGSMAPLSPRAGVGDDPVEGGAVPAAAGAGEPDATLGLQKVVHGVKVSHDRAADRDELVGVLLDRHGRLDDAPKDHQDHRNHDREEHDIADPPQGHLDLLVP